MGLLVLVILCGRRGRAVFLLLLLLSRSSSRAKPVENTTVVHAEMATPRKKQTLLVAPPPFRHTTSRVLFPCPFPQVLTLQRATGREGEEEGRGGADAEGPGPSSRRRRRCCRELVLVKEMGVCVPREGSAWGLSPRLVLGDTGAGLGRRQPRWDGLMPSISGMAGQGMVVNLGHAPFRHPMDGGYLPVSEVAHADARFVLQVYDDDAKMWQDVRPRWVPCGGAGSRTRRKKEGVMRSVRTGSRSRTAGVRAPGGK